ncbi:unnamed protein product [Aphis gossypii]|uniref:Uncharacterized protein n=1 Tax=Aphis gossypii TaxID=80765 RepID=A0A9P0JCL2_APHGO|nr:unnamed protein product [Aphis gossypii]
MYNVCCDSIIPEPGFWGLFKRKKCTKATMCERCSERRKKLGKNYHHYNSVAKISSSLRYYFKHLPDFLYHGLAYYSRFDIEVDMRSYFETLYIDNTDHGHQKFKEMLCTNSIMGDMHTDRAFIGNNYWKVLIYKVILNHINCDQALNINNWWMDRQYAHYDLSVTNNMRHGHHKSHHKSAKKYAMETTTIHLSDFEPFMFNNLFKTYLTKAAESYYYENQNDLWEDDDKRTYVSDCEEYDELKYLHYIRGKCVVLLMVYGVKNLNIGDVLTVHDYGIYYNLVFSIEKSCICMPLLKPLRCNYGMIGTNAERWSEW